MFESYTQNRPSIEHIRESIGISDRQVNLEAKRLVDEMHEHSRYCRYKQNLKENDPEKYDKVMELEYEYNNQKMLEGRERAKLREQEKRKYDESQGRFYI